jgi:hypothetical protein
MTDPGSIAAALTGSSLIADPLQSALRSALGVGFGLAGSWAIAGAASALRELAQILNASTSPDLTGAWFTTTYWKVASLAAALTLPFLFIAAVEAVLRGQPALLAQAVFVQLPTALIGTGIAVPLISLLLAATDEMCALVSSGTSGAASFLVSVAGASTTVSVLDGDSFIICWVAVLTVLAALMLMVELLIRQAAVYVVVLMLPLAFAAMVWPARRVWATRVLELLLALILSKFVIVAVLSLAGTALGDDHVGWQLLSAMTLIFLSCCSPWALMRLLPFTEVAAHASEGIHQSARDLQQRMSAVTGHRGGSTGVPASLAAASESDDPLLDPTPFRERESDRASGNEFGMDEPGQGNPDQGGPALDGPSVGDTAAERPDPSTVTADQPANTASEGPTATAGSDLAGTGISGDDGFSEDAPATGQAAFVPADVADTAATADPGAGAQEPENPFLDSGDYVPGDFPMNFAAWSTAVRERGTRASDPALAPVPDPANGPDAAPGPGPDAAPGADPDDMPDPADDPSEYER